MIPLNETHDPSRTSWVASARGHADFPIQNLPLGVFSTGGRGPRVGVAIGEEVLDLTVVSSALNDELRTAATSSTLNAYLTLPATARMELRKQVSLLLSDSTQRAAVERALVPQSACTMVLPARIGDYSDFYVGIHHANNIGRQYRPDNPLLPNYRHVPIGYHGRASSIRVSGHPVIRPRGQTKAPDEASPRVGPSTKLDYEQELAVWIAGDNALGECVPIAKAPERIAGYGLLNDWSARDIQGWEAQPLGPFLAKSFQTSVSPWLVTAEALAPYRVAQPLRAATEPRPLPYLWDDDDQAHGALGVTVEVWLIPAGAREPALLSRTSATHMYWTPAQLVTHHTSNGCDLQPGDLIGTGTISSPDRTGLGSLMELSEGGKSPLTLPNGEQRSFLEDGDEVILTAYAQAEGRPRLGFGECRGVVRGARDS
jgi:fumarylacetoacetase